MNAGQPDQQALVQNVANCIRMSQSGKPDQIKQAEQQLESQQQNANFGPLLLRLITNDSVDANIKLGAAIYFKNYVKKYWGHEQDIICVDDQNFIKTAIVRVMLHCDKNSQRLLSEAITIIASHDFYRKWDTLLPELIEKLKSEQNFENICGVLRIIESITCRYPDKEQNVSLVEEIRYILELFQDLWLTLLRKWSQPIVESFGTQTPSQGPPQSVVSGGAPQINQVRYQILSLEQLILIFFDLNSVDLIEFFENKMSSWAKLFELLLQTDDKFNIFGSASDVPGPLDRVRTAIVRALKLFNSKYEEEYSKYVPSFVQFVCLLLTTINDDERYDQLAAESIAYLSSVACQQWNAKLFSKTQILNDIVQRILMRNIRLRESDINMYETNGEDWTRRDMEGSDLYTRRRGAVDLVRALCQNFEAEITTIILSHVATLMRNYQQNPAQNFIDKDTAINLILAVSIKGQTKLMGATKLNTHVPVMQFFQQHILPELQASKKSAHPIILSDCLKFVIIFRSQWPKDNFLQLLPMSTTFLSNEDYVLHTYAAIAIDKILAMREYETADKTTNKENHSAAKPNVNGAAAPTFAYKYPKTLILESLQGVLSALFTVLATYEESYTNEYVMKCIMRVISRAEHGCVAVIEPVVKHCCGILQNVSKNPQKPLFNHYLFECMAALIRFVCDDHYDASNNRENIVKFEQVLMTPFLRILDMDQASEFHPYIYQLIGLMLRIRNRVDSDYASLFDKLLETSLWNNDGNIVAISGTFADYLRLVKVEEFVDDRRLTGMLGIYQHLLSKRTQDFHAFKILSAIFQYVPLVKLSKYLKEIVELVCIRIRAKKSTALCGHFIVALSVFIYRHGVAPLLAAAEQIQPGIFSMIVEKIWLVYARHVTDLIDRKILTIGMIKMCHNPAFLQNPKLAVFYPQIVECVVHIFEAGPLQSNEQKTAEFYLSKLEEQGAGNKFCGLSFAKSPSHDVTAQEQDPRKVLLQCLSGTLGGDANMKQQLSKQLSVAVRNSVNRYAQQFNVGFMLPTN